MVALKKLIVISLAFSIFTSCSSLPYKRGLASETTESDSAVAGSYGTPNRPLTALNFFDPIHPNTEALREPSWPQKLTLSDPIKMSVNEFNALRQSTKWRVVYHCNGYPLTAESIYRGKGYDGYFNESIAFIYKEKSFTREMYPSHPLGMQRAFSKKPVEVIVSKKLRVRNGDIPGFFEQSSSVFVSGSKAVRIIKETGEKVITSPSASSSATCPDHLGGGRRESILVPMSLFLSMIIF